MIANFYMFLALLARHQEFNICIKWSLNTLVSFVYQQTQQSVSTYCAQFFPLYIVGQNFSAGLLHARGHYAFILLLDDGPIIRETCRN